MLLRAGEEGRIVGLTSKHKFCIKKEDRDDRVNLKVKPPPFQFHLRREGGEIILERRRSNDHHHQY